MSLIPTADAMRQRMASILADQENALRDAIVKTLDNALTKDQVTSINVTVSHRYPRIEDEVRAAGGYTVEWFSDRDGSGYTISW